MTPEEFLERAASGDASVLPDLRRHLLSIVHERGGHDAWARVCEKLGQHALALRELELAVRDEPDRLDLLLDLAERYLEHGRHESAARLLSRARDLDPNHRRVAELLTLIHDETDPSAEEPRISEAEAAPTDADAVRMLSLFRGRDDLYARQWVDDRGRVGYSPVRDPLTPAVVRGHLLGNHTVGVYVIRVDDTVKFFAIDLDLNRSALERARSDPDFARRLRDDLRAASGKILRDLRSFGFDPLFENSGYKGRHYWVFLERPEPVDVVYNLGALLLPWLQIHVPETMHLEFFPKQPTRKGGEGVGNLIKLPLGVHRKTGRRSELLDDQGRPLQRPWEALRRVRPLGHETLYDILVALRERSPQPRRPAEPPEDASPPIPAGPPPPAVPPDWTDADYETHPQISHLLRSCPVLAELRRRAMEHRSLSYDEQMVLIHTMGHLPAGVPAVNDLLSRCGNVPSERLLKSPLSGNPMSCPKIRQRVPHVTARVNCECPVDEAGRYPTPVLHLAALEKKKYDAPPPPDPEWTARRYAELQRRRAEIEREIARSREALVELLRRSPERCVRCPGGRYVLREKEGIEEIEWVPDEAGAAQEPGAAG